MRWIRPILAEFLGLFVDDAAFAVAILAWLVVIWLVPPMLQIPAPWRGPLLFFGLAAILVESALRRSRDR
jgi:hypothetical protein